MQAPVLANGPGEPQAGLPRRHLLASRQGEEKNRAVAILVALESISRCCAR